MRPDPISRRRFLQTLSSSAAAAALPACGFHSGGALFAADDEKPKAKVERAGIGVIGLKYQGTVIAEQAKAFGDVVALCDVDREILEKSNEKFGGGKRLLARHQELLARPEVDVVLIGTPDHWHTQMLIDAVRAGKDVYCEKPLTLTIDEGKILRKAVRDSGRVVQVGTWQRSDENFRLAVEMVRQGRIGTLRKVTCATDKNPTGGPFATAPVPKHFDWNQWQGQTPDTSYIPERSHYTFRWWYEYSGGKMTDWGAHHVDIAQWAINSLPVHIEGQATHPTFEGMNGYNVAKDFAATVRYANGVVLEIADHGRNGILFEGDAGKIFVNRGVLAGKPVDDLKTNPLKREDYQLYAADNLTRPPRTGKLDAITNHMGNFFDCLQSRKETLSDLESQHRSVSTCHLANISMRLGRPLDWDSSLEVFPKDAEANRWLKRDQRRGFEIG